MMKNDLVKKYQSHAKDTGSTEVQVVLLTDRVIDLAKHLKKYPKDADSRRGLLIMVGKRRRLLNYLRKNDQKSYEKLIKDLGLKK
ncbi:MAG: 30S ribosomal protein S15 [Patescibacteria group bacterium]